MFLEMYQFENAAKFFSWIFSAKISNFLTVNFP